MNWPHHETKADRVITTLRLGIEKIQAHHIGQLLQEVRVARKLESLGQVRLDLMALPEPVRFMSDSCPSFVRYSSEGQPASFRDGNENSPGHHTLPVGVLRVCRWPLYGSAALVKVVRPVALRLDLDNARSAGNCGA